MILNPPDEKYTIDVCKRGKGGETCRYLTMSPKGWSCEKHSDMALYLDRRAASGRMSAQSDNCKGRGSQ